MIPLRDQWQQLRQQRQQQIGQRRQQVQVQLETWQQERSVVAIATAQSLQEFVSRLQVETADFLAAAAEARQERAVQLLDSLQLFRETLQANVTQLRFDNQQLLAQMEAEVRTYLADCRQRRQAQSLDMMADLANYVETLRQTVTTLLADAANQRQQQASELKEKLQQDRQSLQQVTRALMKQLALSRQARQRQVWGKAVVVTKGTHSVVPTGRSANGQTTLATQRPMASRPVSSKPSGSTKTLLSRSTSQKLVTKPAPGQKFVAKPALAVPTQLKSAPTAIPVSTPFPIEPAQPVDTVAVLNTLSETILNDTEQAVFEYLEDSLDGARVIEIEKALGIQRLKTVDALRSLLKQGLIAQKDRMYFIQ